MTRPALAHVLCLVLVLCLMPLVLMAETGSPESRQLKYRFADAEEGRTRRFSNTDYFERRLTQTNLDYRMGKKGTTLEEYRAYSATQVIDFTDEEKAVVDAIMDNLEAKLSARGLVLPEMAEITFVNGTFKDEGGAAACTMGDDIYLCGPYFRSVAESGAQQGQNLDFLTYIMAHEVFHVLTRNNPEFRATMYGLIGFTVGEEFVFPESISEYLMANPDVDHIDSSAIFTIDGKPRECAVVCVLNPYEDGKGGFMENRNNCLVPVDTMDRVIPVSEVSDFFDVVGKNTGYIDATEECMADNFGFAVAFGMDGMTGQGYESPEIIEAILAYLSTSH